MYETSEEVTQLQRLLTESRSRATSHLQEIISGDNALSAAELLPRLEGMRVLSLATVTAKGEPRISAVDGHFIHGSWIFGTDGRSAKARHLLARPAVSAAHIDGEKLGFFTHGSVVTVDESDPSFSAVIAHWTQHYGTDPRTWGDDIRMYRIEATWCVAYRGGE